MTKAELRYRLQAARKQLTQTEVTSKSHLISSRVIADVDWPKIKSAHCYIDMPSVGEVQTGELMQWMRRRGIFIKTPGPQVTVEELTHHFDLIIVPIVGFDINLNRLGFGGGYYDRLLEVQEQAFKIGLGYDLSLIKSGLPIEPHDQPLDIIYTESTNFSKEPPRSSYA